MFKHTSNLFCLSYRFKKLCSVTVRRLNCQQTDLCSSVGELTYGELLRAIRIGHVSEIKWLNDSVGHPNQPEGSCIVKLKEGVTKLSYVPFADDRFWYVLQNHGVNVGKMNFSWNEDEEQMAIAPTKISHFIYSLTPLLGIGVIFAFTQWVALRAGDREDRKKLRDKKVAEIKQKEKEAREIRYLTAAYESVDDKESADQLEILLDKYNVDISNEVKLAAAERKRILQMKSQTTVEPKLSKTKDSFTENVTEKSPNPYDRTGHNQSNVEILKSNDPLRTRLQTLNLTSSLNLHYRGKEKPVFFEDVAGIDETRYELEELITFFHKPERFRASGADIPKGVLLCGPPGNGKTLLARAVAGESGVSFLSVSASQFVEMFVGIGSARMRDLFSQARQMAPAIIFIDEIDAIGRVRGTSSAGGTDERDLTLNQLLSLIDGFDEDTGVIVLGATNRKDILDPALIRPGRFDRVITVGLPDLNGRVDVLKTHLKQRKAEPDLNLREVSYECQGFSGAQLANLVNIAGMYALRHGGDMICVEDLFAALEFTRLGPVRRTPLSADVEKKVAVQVAGISLLASLLPTIENVWTVSILPRENTSIGKPVLKLDENRVNCRNYTRNYLEEQLVLTLGGRAAEMVLCDEHDVSIIGPGRFSNARIIASKLMADAAMSTCQSFGSFHTACYASDLKADEQIVPEHSFQKIDELDNGRRDIVIEGILLAENILSKNIRALKELVNYLIKYKSLSGTELRLLLEQNADANDLYWTQSKGSFRL